MSDILQFIAAIETRLSQDQNQDLNHQTKTKNCYYAAHLVTGALCDRPCRHVVGHVREL